MACGSCANSSPLTRSFVPAIAAGTRPKPVRDRIAAFLAAITQAEARMRQRRALSALDDRMLADIGKTRDEAREEACRPFWQ